MLKTKEVEVKRTETEIDEATCDWCGKRFSPQMTSMNGYGEINLFFGYGSKFDDDKWIAEICDDCFEKHLKPKMRLSGG